MSGTWKTKYGLRRVRHDPPTLAEAIQAAEGLTDDRDQQVQFAAELMGAAPADVRAELKKIAPDRRPSLTMIAPARDKPLRTIVVERKVSRRQMTPLQRSANAALRSH